MLQSYFGKRQHDKLLTFLQNFITFRRQEHNSFYTKFPMNKYAFEWIPSSMLPVCVLTIFVMNEMLLHISYLSYTWFIISTEVRRTSNSISRPSKYSYMYLIQSNLDISNSDISNSAIIEASV